MVDSINELEDMVYLLTHTDNYGTEILGYSRIRSELEKIINVYKFKGVYADYSYDNLRIVKIYEIEADKDAYDCIKNKELVNYEKVEIILKLDKNRDEHGLFAYFKTEPDTVYHRILEDGEYEKFDFCNYSFSNKEITLKIQSKDCLKVLDMCRSWKNYYYKNGLEWLMETIGKYRKFG